MASPHRLIEPSRPDVTERNRWTVRVLLTIVLVLVVATILVGIRW
jgi:hypothetical protein